MDILGIDLVCTCEACPEQYDAFVEGKKVGYFRLRHGTFRVDYLDCGGETIWREVTIGDGIFDKSERDGCLERGCFALLGRLKQDEQNTIN